MGFDVERTREAIRICRKKKWCAVSQSRFRENDSQHLYSDCAWHPDPEPHEFPHGIGLHYPIIPRKEVDYLCEDICEDEALYLASRKDAEIPTYMLPKPTSQDKASRHVLVFPHRNRPPYRQPVKKRLTDLFYNLEAFDDLPYSGLHYLQSCLSFESILDKLDTNGQYPRDAKARAMALRLLLHLPQHDPDSQQDEASTATSLSRGRVHHRIYLTTKGMHHRMLTPRVDPSIVEQMGKSNAVVLIQKCLRGRAQQVAVEKTRAHWEESYEELNGFNISYQVDPNSSIELVTYATEMTIVRAYVGQFIASVVETLVKPNAVQPSEGTDGRDGGQLQTGEGGRLAGQLGGAPSTSELWGQQRRPSQQQDTPEFDESRGDTLWGNVVVHR